jgi:hypothetical protein
MINEGVIHEGLKFVANNKQYEVILADENTVVFLQDGIEDSMRIDDFKKILEFSEQKDPGLLPGRKYKLQDGSIWQINKVENSIVFADRETDIEDKKRTMDLEISKFSELTEGGFIIFI